MFEAIAVFKSFSKRDIKQFRIFINSEYFNTNKNLVKLYDVIIKFVPTFNKNELNNDYIASKINVGNESTLRNLLKDLKKLGERYLAQYRFENYRYLYKTILIEELHTRSITKLLKKNILSLEMELNEINNFSSTDFHLRFILENIKFERDFLWEIDKKKEFVDLKIRQITKMYDQLFIYYYLLCQDMNINLIEYHQKLNKTHPGNYYINRINNLSIELEQIISNGSINDFYLKIFRIHTILKEMKTGTNKFTNFVEYYRILSEIASKLDIDEKYNFFTGYHYLFPEIMDHPGFQNIELSFYDMYFENKAFKNSGRNFLPLNGFKYFYTRADTLGRYEWTDKLFEEYIDSIEEKLRENVICLRNSYIFFRRDKDFNKALEELNRVENFSDPTIKRDIYHLYILIFFEKRDLEMVQLYIHRLEIYLSKSTLPNILQNEFLLFTKFMKKMIELKSSKCSKYQINQFLKVAKDSKKFPSKPWFIEKIMELFK